MFYYFALYLVKFLLFVRCRVVISGIEHVPRQGGACLVANHSTLLDPVIIGTSITKRKIRFMSKKELFRFWAFRKLIISLGAFPVDREFTDRVFIREVTGYLRDKEEIVLIFGEGTRNRNKDHAVMPLKSGFAFLAKRAGVPVIPMYVSGADQILKPFWRPKLRVSFSQPLKIDDIQRSTHLVQIAMEELAKKHRGKWS